MAVEGVFGVRGIAGGGSSGNVELEFATPLPNDMELPGNPTLAVTPSIALPATSRRVADIAYVRNAIADPNINPGGGGPGPGPSLTAVAPLQISDSNIQLAVGSQPGQVLTWSGSAWAAQLPPPPGVTLTATAPLHITDSTIGLMHGNAVGEVLTWSGFAWSPVLPAPGTALTAVAPLHITDSSIQLVHGSQPGQVLTWSGSGWSAQLPTLTEVLTAAAPLQITDNNIQLTHGSVAGQVLTWSGTHWLAQEPTAAPGPTHWGTILGTLSAQEDLREALDLKQDLLVSGSNIRTINGQPVLGAGNLQIDAPGVGDVLVRGELGTYARGTHFEGTGQPSLQEFLDANINGRWFEPRPGGAINLVIEAGTVARTAAVTIRNVFMQGLTLIVQTQAQFAGVFTISGFTGSLDIGGTGAWGNAVNFATHVNVQNVTGTVRLGGGSSIRRFNDVSFFGCSDARLDAGAVDTFQIAGALTAANSNVLLVGQAGSSHSYNLTNLDAGSQLEISNSLSNVNLGAGGRRQGWVLDWRTGNALDTFARGAGGAITGGDVNLVSGIATVTHLQRRPVADLGPSAGWGLMWTAQGWSPGQFLRPGDGIAAIGSTVTPITYTHEGVTHNLGATTVQGALENLFRWFITDVQPPPEPPPAQSFHSLAVDRLSFQTAVPSGTVVATISVALTPAHPPFNGTVQITSGTGFQIQGMNLVTVGTLAAGPHNITLTATQSGISGSLVEPITLIGTAAGEIPPLPEALPGETTLNAEWFANGERMNEQTWMTPPFDCQVSRSFVRLTTPNTTPQEAALAYYLDGAPSGIDISDRFALNQAPGLIEITNIDRNVIIPRLTGSVGNTIYFRSTGPTGSISSAGTVRVFVHPPGVPPNPNVPALPAVPAGQIGIDSFWVAGGGTIGAQTNTSAAFIPQESRLASAVIRVTGPDTVASEAAIRWLPAGASDAVTLSGLAPLYQEPGLVHVGGLNTTQVLPAGGRIYWGAMGAVVNVNSVASARIFLQPTGTGPGPLPEPGPGETALTFSWSPGPDSVGVQTSGSSVPFRCRAVRAVVRLTVSNVLPGIVCWVSHFDNVFTWEHHQISNTFPLDQAPGLIEVTGLQTTRIIENGDVLLYRATSGAEVTSTATARIFIVPA